MDFRVSKKCFGVLLPSDLQKIASKVDEFGRGFLSGPAPGLKEPRVHLFTTPRQFLGP
jgi:hypothetical protein